MALVLKKIFNKHPKTLHVLVLGAGVMGKRHIRALIEVSDKVLQPRYGTRLQISVVDREENCLQILPNRVKKYESLDVALATNKPDMILQAFNDQEHANTFKQVFAACPNLKAILTEKPLTSHLSEAHEIEAELRKRYLSMNTVSNFSPVFDRVSSLLPELTKKYGALQLMGFESIWGKNRTADPRPSIGIPSEAVHALSIVTDMFEQDNLVMEKGEGLSGYLSTNAPDVIYEMESRFISSKTGIKMNFHASYVFEQQERRVTAYYQIPSGNVISLEMEFDVKVDGQNKDSLKVYEIDKKTGALTLLASEYPEHIVNGVEENLLPNDRITAFISLSLLSFISNGPDLGDVSARLGTLDKALQIQGMIEQIKPGQASFHVRQVDANPHKLQKPKYPRLMAEDNADRLARIRDISPKPQRKSIRAYKPVT